MSSNSGLLRGMLWSIIWGCLPAITAFGQTASENAPRIAPVPPDPPELATGQIQFDDTPASREAALQLLARTRSQFALRSNGQAYDLKVSFTVDSLGKTNYDGAWQMEDLFAPKLGHRWTATAASGYTVTGIATAGKIYGDGASSAVPLRLLEARGVLFDPLQSPAYADRGSIRTSTATFRGATVTCLLLSRSRNTAHPASGRDWEEAEECIDPQSGLLQVHSEVPGRYAVYDYTDAPQLAGHILPRSVTIMEAGRIVSKVRVESLDGLSAPDPDLFVPSDQMKAKGEAVTMTSATKVTRVHGQGPFTSAMTLRVVCVFGMVTPTGHLVEAHALQPSDPNSQAAVEDAMKIDFSPLTPAGAPPRQHFAFVIEKFIAQK
ncbi:exported hypothetical protein [Candidatus Sulfopaludibacter sp. SbA6]|nr:exported hypothetical protein [Candidatus Sulfopaludibacter sp. SbA6]